MNFTAVRGPLPVGHPGYLGRRHRHWQSALAFLVRFELDAAQHILPSKHCDGLEVVEWEEDSDSFRRRLGQATNQIEALSPWHRPIFNQLSARAASTPGLAFLSFEPVVLTGREERSAIAPLTKDGRWEASLDTSRLVANHLDHLNGFFEASIFPRKLQRSVTVNSIIWSLIIPESTFHAHCLLFSHALFLKRDQSTSPYDGSHVSWPEAVLSARR